MTGRQFALSATRAVQVFLAHLTWLLTIFLVSAGLLPWYAIAMPIGLFAFTYRLRRHVAPGRSTVEPPSTPRLELKAPNPEAGQCPVCSLTDLDERAIGDELLGDAGTAFARVVAYGPHRAHSECAAVVPYTKPHAPGTAAVAEHTHFGSSVDGHWTYCCEAMRESAPCACGECERQRSEFMRSVRAACGIAPGPGEPEPSDAASRLINSGRLGVDEARRIARAGVAADGRARVGHWEVAVTELGEQASRKIAKLLGEDWDGWR
jgi:hypothetical protein